ncbi:PREDICTED: uncharacterized protein LOC105961422 isoform X2 [Erythranthe guttata]|uniref:uncharacterized protein LOC105961422 isoform X2 n=1 Tax=Erythranthe guttata TaxID=4155 RepID=UPI00064DC3B2|nr:PREDICTED: uncharacterized protein LOC105961422 isoform X2 [Erythranthe guttata]|eukprot:XP_012841106.1 PREDICTED: uncharacterized protein LOC105961422 isoform X2 [Erythranthe guttata]
MDFNSQGINQLYPPRIPPPSNYDPFSDRCRRDLGHNQQHNFYRDHQFNPRNMRDAAEIEIELEKERIREEMIMHEIRKRLYFEDEAKRNQLMERESALPRWGPYFSSPKMDFKSQTSIPLAHGRSLEERIAISLEEKIRLNGRFHRGSAGRRISKPFNPERGESMTGLKRKAPGVEFLPNHFLKKKAKEEWE